MNNRTPVKMTIDAILLNEIAYPRVPSEAMMQEWVNAVLEAVPEKVSPDCTEVCISIVDKSESAELNQTYRHKTGPTNILSFHYDPMPDMAQESLGDLVICAELVEEEALIQSKTTEAHWAHLTVHGTLHLLGYDHVVDSEAEIMESLEITILNALGFENPYE